MKHGFVVEDRIYISRVSLLPVSGWSFHRILSYSPCSLLKGLAIIELSKVWSYAALWKTLHTMLHKAPSSVLFRMVNYLWFWINNALLVHLLVADLMHPFTQSYHTSVWSTTMALSPWTSFENDAELNPLTSTQEIKEHFQLFVTAMWLYTQRHECILTAPAHEPLYVVVNLCFCTYLTLFHCRNWCGAVHTVIHTHHNSVISALYVTYYSQKSCALLTYNEPSKHKTI